MDFSIGLWSRILDINLKNKAVLWRSNLWGVAYFNLSEIGCDCPIEYSGYNDISYFIEYWVNRACEVSSMLIVDGIDGWVRPSQIQTLLNFSDIPCKYGIITIPLQHSSSLDSVDSFISSSLLFIYRFTVSLSYPLATISNNWWCGDHC
jgi:hypothetical protein